MKGKLKKYSIFQITSMVLLVILIIAIIVELAIIISLKSKIDDLDDKNSKLPTTESVLEENNTENTFDLNFEIQP